MTFFGDKIEELMKRLWQSTLTEIIRAIRSRRALVIVILYLAMSLLSMNGAISILSAIENEVATVLSLPKNDENPGAISETIWKSNTFRRAVKKIAPNSLVYDDIQGKHPVELISALFAFLYVPLLTILISANRVSDDLRSGSVRYMITRVTRFEWSFGKYLGIAIMLLFSLLLGGFAAWAVAMLRLGGADFSELLFGILGWSMKAWVLSLAWLGISLGISHFFHSGAKATALATVAMTFFMLFNHILSGLAKFFGGVWNKLEYLSFLCPGGLENGLWRTSFLPVAIATLSLILLGLFYFSIGYAFFARKDAR